MGGLLPAALSMSPVMMGRFCKVRQSAHTDYGSVIHSVAIDRPRGRGTAAVRDSAMERGD